MSEEEKKEEKEAESKEGSPYRQTIKALEWEKERLQKEIDVLKLRLEKCMLEKKLKETE